MQYHSYSSEMQARLSGHISGGSYSVPSGATSAKNISSGGHFSRSWIPLRQRDPVEGTSWPKTLFILCSSEVVLFLREKEYPERSLRDRKLRGGLCRAGAGHRDFDSPGQVSGKSIEITKLVCSPLAMCIAIAQCSVSLMYGADESHNGKASKSQTLLAHPYLSFVSISWAIFDRPPAATDARESETKRDSAYLMIDTNLRRISSWMAW